VFIGTQQSAPSTGARPVTLTPRFLRRSVRTRLVAAFLGVAALMVLIGLVNVARMNSIHGQVESLSARTSRRWRTSAS
jgi:hypothetical protein